MDKKLHQQLQAQSKEWLVDRLAELAREDAAIKDRLLLFLAIQKDTPAAVADFKSVLDNFAQEVREHGPYDWRDRLPDKVLWNVWEALGEAAKNDRHSLVREVAEYALLKIDTINGLQDECELEYVTGELHKLHANACKNLKLDPEDFGKHLANLANKCEWWVFDGPPAGYAEILGEAGMQAYKDGLRERK